ncbi:MAG: ferredoxin [Proteobacteria bacterium]|nr:ferredoxin [Pseudomonadota bacterium]
MAYIVGEACIRCKFTDCAEVCPVECFHEAEHMLVIDPVECIDCGACIPECPIDAIFFDEDLPIEQQDFIQINEELSKTTPIIVVAKEPHPEKDRYLHVQHKKHLI